MNESLLRGRLQVQVLSGSPTSPQNIETHCFLGVLLSGGRSVWRDAREIVGLMCPMYSRRCPGPMHASGVSFLKSRAWGNCGG
jgi:hypothetical protein